MRAFTLTTLAALAALLIAPAPAPAQEAPDGWVRLQPEREGFVAHMPAPPATRDVRAKGGALKLAGRSYVATGGGGAAYTVLALNDSNKVGERLVGESAYLDEIAEVAWEAFVAPEIERLRKEKVTNFDPAMEYRREFRVAGRPAREYFVKLRHADGPVHIYADGARVYVVAALGTAAQYSRLRRFVGSFSPDASSPERPEMPEETAPGVGSGVGSGVGPGRGGGVGTGPGIGPGEGTGTGTGIGQGRGENVFGAAGGGAGGGGEIDYTRVFNQREVGQKAVILHKPDPGFTESARKFTVTGVVRLRVVLNRTGEVTNIGVIKGLPHGLTARAVNAARGSKFKPAQKDGRAVSQYVTFEYNFNIY